MNGNMYGREESGRHVLYFYKENKLSEESENKTIDRLRELWEENGYTESDLDRGLFWCYQNKYLKFVRKDWIITEIGKEYIESANLWLLKV